MALEELTAAIAAARAAEDVIRSFYQKNLARHAQGGPSPVTEADVRAEEIIRETPRARVPRLRLLRRGDGQHAMRRGERVAGRSDRWHQVLRARGTVLLDADRAHARRASWCSESPARRPTARSPGRRRAAAPSSTSSRSGSVQRAADRRRSLHRQPQEPHPRRRSWQRLGALIRTASRIRGYGDFVHYHLLARGALDVVIESDVNILDIAALAVIVREAGGMFTDLAGGAVDARRPRACWPATARCTQPCSAPLLR